MVAAYTTMLPNIAPAPGPAQGQQQMAAQAAPMAGQPITAQMGPALQQQQFFVNPQAMPAGATAAAPIPMTQFATYNQQGQLVIQQMPLQIPANQQPGQQQILYTNAAAVAAQQQAQQQQPKPGQPMMAAGPPGGAVAGKPMAAMPGTAVSQNYAIAGSGSEPDPAAALLEATASCAASCAATSRLVWCASLCLASVLLNWATASTGCAEQGGTCT